MSSELARFEKCSKFYLSDYNRARRYVFSRVFLNRKRLPEKLAASAIHALSEINLAINKGDKINVIGPAGAGKTVLGWLLAGIANPSSGSVKTEGRVGYLAKIVDVIPPLMTLRQYLGFSTSLGGLRGGLSESAIERALEVTGLSSSAATFVRDMDWEKLSGVRLELLKQSNVSALVLDEPSEEILEAITQRGDFRSVTIVALSRKPRFALADRWIVLSRGKVIFDGAPSAGREAYDVAMAEVQLPVNAQAMVTEVDEDGDEEDSDELVLTEEELRAKKASRAHPVPNRATAEEINGYIARTEGTRRGHGGILIDYIWSSPAPSAEERAGRLRFFCGKDQKLCIGYRVRDPKLLGEIPFDLNWRFTNAEEVAVMTLSSAVLGWTPAIDRERGSIVFEVKRFGLIPGRYGLRVTLEYPDGVQDKVQLADIVTVEPGNFYGTGLYPRNQLGEVCPEYVMNLEGPV